MLQRSRKMSDYHEPPNELTDEIRDAHRALTSLKEEIEAVDWYSQRAACITDADLRRVIEHNRDEEIEHACLALEWLRRHRPEWSKAMNTFLFKDGDLLSLEEQSQEKPSAESGSVRGLRELAIGSLKASLHDAGEQA
jgi:ferritin-like protein